MGDGRKGRAYHLGIFEGRRRGSVTSSGRLPLYRSMINLAFRSLDVDGSGPKRGISRKKIGVRN